MVSLNVTKDKKLPPPEGKGDDEEPLSVDALAAKVLEAGTAPDSSASNQECPLPIHLARVVVDRGPAHKQPTDQIISSLIKNR